MTHRRQTIRNTIQSLLVSNTNAGANVDMNPGEPAWHEQLPALRVVYVSESLDELTQAPRSVKRQLQIAVEIIADGATSSAALDAADAIAEQIETILSVDDTLSGSVDDILLTSVDFDLQENGQQKICVVRNIYTATYVTDMPMSSTLQTDGADIRDLETLHVEYQVGHDDSSPSDDVIDAEQTINL